MKRYKAYLRKCGRIHLLFYFENGANKPFNDRAVYKYTVLVSLPISRGTCYSDFNLSVPSYFYFLEYRDFFPPLDISISISAILTTPYPVSDLDTCRNILTNDDNLFKQHTMNNSSFVV